MCQTQININLNYNPSSSKIYSTGLSASRNCFKSNALHTIFIICIITSIFLDELCFVFDISQFIWVLKFQDISNIFDMEIFNVHSKFYLPTQNLLLTLPEIDFAILLLSTKAAFIRSRFQSHKQQAFY